MGEVLHDAAVQTRHRTCSLQRATSEKRPDPSLQSFSTSLLIPLCPFANTPTHNRTICPIPISLIFNSSGHLCRYSTWKGNCFLLSAWYSKSNGAEEIAHAYRANRMQTSNVSPLKLEADPDCDRSLNSLRRRFQSSCSDIGQRRSTKTNSQLRSNLRASQRGAKKR